MKIILLIWVAMLWMLAIYIFSPGGNTRRMEDRCFKAGGYAITDHFGVDFKGCQGVGK